ncbi:beta-glucosidase BglX [Pseudomonas sp. FP603]|uniref:beta-glucosidase n=2 Tax=Pseudomonas TaxID=286 RepID=A0ABY9GN04_9PSED|nr:MULTISPECIES: beta-glucosidase BglX [unclassified Pseudomonas]WLI11285.1 beta-glucosidase BglX [Pseudomonas sp. FP603]WLI17119.1 beta-glucosidase BglX [Pseudomonas sp. FP607]
MKRLRLLCALIGFTSLPVVADMASLSKEAFVSNLINQMTLEEKIGQLRLIAIDEKMTPEKMREEIAAGRIGGTYGSVSRYVNRPMQDAAQQSRLKIPMFFGWDVIHGHRTIFPIGLALASSWDIGAIELSGRIAAKEASADGIDMTFAPMIDIARDPRWGRTSEGFGEDTYLVSRIAKAMVQAYQGTSPNAPDSIMASAKHFALYGAVEGGRDYNSVDMGLARMHQDYLPPYRSAIEGGAGAMMVALNSINGVPAASNAWLMQDLLRKAWGFKGLVISDHNGINDLVQHGVAKNHREAARLAIRAGVAMSMNDFSYGPELPGLLESGAISQSNIDNAVREVLGAKYDMGLFEDPYRRIGVASEDPADNNAEHRLHRAQAREVARKTLVLLKNENGLLPLKKEGVIALIGPLAKSTVDIMGSWSASGVPAQSVTIYDGLKNAMNQGSLIYARGANLEEDQEVVKYLEYQGVSEIANDPRPAAEMIDEAVKAAQQADVVIAVVGEPRSMSHEAASRTSLDLPGRQSELITALKATGKPLVLVLMNGRPLSIGKEQKQADAILETWYSGSEGGNAVADVLFGDYNPSGKLPITFPRSVGQIPNYYSHLNTGRPYIAGGLRNYTSQYFDQSHGPLYPFGYGLSYTDFSLTDMALSSTTLSKTDNLVASIMVKNVGPRDGETVVQLYIRDVVGTVSRPVKELKNFQKIMLKAGEEKAVHFSINENDLKFFNTQLEYAAEPGEFRVQIGLDSQNVKEQSFELLPEQGSG